MGKKQKNIFIFLVLMVYTSSVFGVVINKHFCGDELESITILEKGSCCENETPEESSDCCKDEIIYISNKCETIAPAINLDINPAFHFLHIVPASVTDGLQLSALSSNGFTFPGEKPPSLRDNPLQFLMVYRI